jgi:uncharacterized alkaline shock family protein YloU
MEGQSISPEVLARYAGDAAREVPGVSGLAESPLHRGRAVELSSADGETGVVVHLELEWGSSAKDVAVEVQRRVSHYLERMADAKVGSVDVVFERVGAPPSKR